MGREIRGCVALVTGASRGIGRAVALALAERGCEVALVARTEAGLAETAALCREQGVRAEAVACDLLDPASVGAAVEAVTARLGRLDILVNNAGVLITGPTAEGDPDAWDRMLEVNLLAAMRFTRLALPHLIAGGKGAVILLSSLAGRYTGAGMSAYCASKHGMMGFAGCLFDEVRDHGVKVCAICPGWVNTDMMDGSGVDPGGVIQPGDVAEAVLFAVTSSENACPTEIQIQPQRAPRRTG
ncbi:MAG: SDR family oxidoreductase [Armatimonadetes bacterium]|nr:SDR family oxidoreductase [Armatimonadota bacterium]